MLLTPSADNNVFCFLIDNVFLLDFINYFVWKFVHFSFLNLLSIQCILLRLHPVIINPGRSCSPLRITSLYKLNKSFLSYSSFYFCLFTYSLSACKLFILSIDYGLTPTKDKLTCTHCWSTDSCLFL